MRNYIEEPLKYREIPSEEELIELYINKNMTIVELEKLFNRSENWILRQFRRYNIKKDRNLGIQRRNSTMIKRYGVVNPMQLEEVRKKAEKTSIEKYGVAHPAQSESIKQKTLETNLSRYGYKTKTCDPKVQEDIKEKTRKTCIEKYGRYNVTQVQLEKETFSIITNKDKLIEFINSEKDKTPISLADKLNMSSDRFIKRCREYGITELLKLTGNSSHYEKEISEIYKELKLHKDRKVIKPYEIDLYCDELKIGIEFNGDYWHSKIEDKYYHQNKSLYALEKGVFIYHIFEYEWRNEELRRKIINQLNNLFKLNTTKIYARNCEILPVSRDEKNKFLNNNHIQGKDNSTVNYGLYYKEELVSIMTFCKPRFNKNVEWELSRFCSKSGCNVVGGASKLFKRFLKEYSGDVVSYSDITKTRGNLYKELGFRFEEINKPQYHWVRGGKVLSRYQTRIKDEISVMTSKDFMRVYDCGTVRWVYYRN